MDSSGSASAALKPELKSAPAYLTHIEHQAKPPAGSEPASARSGLSWGSPGCSRIHSRCRGNPSRGFHVRLSEPCPAWGSSATEPGQGFQPGRELPCARREQGGLCCCTTSAGGILVCFWKRWLKQMLGASWRFGACGRQELSCGMKSDLRPALVPLIRSFVRCYRLLIGLKSPPSRSDFPFPRKARLNRARCLPPEELHRLQLLPLNAETPKRNFQQLCRPIKPLNPY